MGDDLFSWAADNNNFDDESIEHRFIVFHRSNPRVYAILCRLARQAMAHGKKRIGIRLLWERMRWELWIETRSDDEFKFNDHYHSRYVRLMIEQEPDLANLFELRRLRAR